MACAEHVCASLRGKLYVLRRAHRPHRPQHTAALGLQRAPWGRSSAHGLLRFPAGECAVRDAACACAGRSLWKPARGFLQTPVPSHTTRLCILPVAALDLSYEYRPAPSSTSPLSKRPPGAALGIPNTSFNSRALSVKQQRLSLLRPCSPQRTQRRGLRFTGTY